MENSIRPPRSTSDRLLILLKTRGSQTTTDLGAGLGITGEAARQQLTKLADDGLAAASAEPRGVGRPTQVWSLTAAGHARFPDAHAELTVQLIRTIRTLFGEEALDRLIAERERETYASYAAELGASDSLKDRVARLAAARDREGYMTEWKEDGDGFILVENHCPICAAAAACQGFCRAELDVFRRVLGEGASVERTEHIVGGDRRCVYRITPRAGDTSGQHE